MTGRSFFLPFIETNLFISHETFIYNSYHRSLICKLPTTATASKICVLLIGDGMGLAQVSLAESLAGRPKTVISAPFLSVFRNFPVLGTATTHSASNHHHMLLLQPHGIGYR